MEHNIILCTCMCSINKYYNNYVHVIVCTCHCVYTSVCVHVTVYTCHCVHVIVCMYMPLCVYVIVCTYHLKFLRSADFNIIGQCANYKYIHMYVYKSSFMNSWYVSTQYLWIKVKNIKLCCWQSLAFTF